MTINGKALFPDSCNDSSFSTVYFDLGDYLIFMSDNFINRQVGHFEFSEATRQLKTIWQYPKGLNDTLFAEVSSLDKENTMTISGRMGMDMISMELLKMKVKSVSKTY